ncbi:MAG: sulfate/molybdate ABC transporter ATP-binding protein [Microthrixaceae bacterium]
MIESTVPGGAVVGGLLGVELGSLTLNAELSVSGGTTTSLLGPNGAGKTTLLRAVAGLRPLTSGHLSIGGVRVDDPAVGRFVAPEARRVALVPQDHLLFDHMTVLDNVAFGLRCRKVDRDESERRATEHLERVGLRELAHERPPSLSGGQSQRVALARALATEPDVLLLDEPMAALDASARPRVRAQLRRWLEDFAGATVLVTHDPLDAWSVAEELVVLEDGRVTQSGPLRDVTARPTTSYVADLVGTNLLSGTASGHEADVGETTVFLADSTDGDVFVTVAPSAISLAPRSPDAEPPAGSQRNHWALEVEAVEPFGERLRVTLGGALSLVAEVTPDSVAELGLHAGSPVWATTKATEVACYPR